MCQGIKVSKLALFGKNHYFCEKVSVKRIFKGKEIPKPTNNKDFKNHREESLVNLKPVPGT